jgi:four helix bundle protein
MCSYFTGGSLAELETQLLLSTDLGYPQNDEIKESIERVRKLLLGLVKYLKGKAVRSKE